MGSLTPWDALPGMLLLLGADGHARAANAALRAFAGLPDAAWTGTGWRALFTPAAAAVLDAGLAQGGDTLELRLDARRGGSQPAWLECSARRQADDGGWLCLLHDVSAATLAKAAAQEQAGLFRLLADNVPVLIAYFRASDNVCEFANKAYARTFGRDEQSIVGMNVRDVIGEEAHRQIQPHVDRVLRDNVPAQYERRMEADGQTRFIEVNLLPHPDESGVVVGAFVLISDITKHRVAELAVRESEERLAKFMHASVEGIVFHKDGYIVDANPPLCALMGYALDEMLGRRTLEFVAPDEVAKVTAVMTSGQETAYESAVVDKHGRRIPVEFIVRTMIRHGERLRMTIVRDIRDRHAAQARIHHLAHHDALTGLPNRMSFMQQIDVLMQAAQVNEGVLALLFIDLDHFKRVNDSLGHLAGDTLLRTTAARIVATLRSTDLVARFGGDEFMVLLTGLSSTGDPRRHAEEVATKLLHAIEMPLVAESRPISVTPSIGIAMFPDDGESADELVVHADTAMYLAKSRGRANFQFFNAGLAGSAYAALVVEGQLAQALERGEFELYFQPQVSAHTGDLVGAEALIRWNHPERGLVMPDEFIPVAERLRLMLPIGGWVLREAARCAARWQQAGLGIAHVAVNLSTVQFQSAGFVDAVAQLLDTEPDAAACLELELTERMLMDDLPDVKERLSRLKGLGLRISVDDFGTGYSSLGHLKDLPIDKVKIDRSFVHDLPGRQHSRAIARAIIQMGQALGLTVIAEGVETAEQRIFLAAQGCDELQGLLVSAPLPLAAFEAWVAARRPAAVVTTSVS